MALRDGTSARRPRVWVVAVAALVASVVAAPRPAAAAAAGDLAIAKASFPATVTAGNRALYRITVTNVGSTHSFRSVEVTDTVAPGTAYEDALSSGWCRPDGGAVKCDVAGPIGPGQSVAFDVVVGTTPATPALLANSAEITASDPHDPFAGNNRAAAETFVTTAADRSSGFLAAGTTAAAGSRSGRAGAYALTAPAASNGVVFGVAAEDPLPTCRATCLYDDAVRVDFEASLGDRQVTDPRNPLVLSVRMGLRTPCRGIGGEDPCFNLRYSAPGKAGGVVPFCTGAGPGSRRGKGIADPSPCKNHQFKTPTGEINFEVLLLSVDPIFY